MSDSPAKESLMTALNLLVFTVIGTAVLASTFYLTRDRIRQSVEAEKLKLIAQIVPTTLYDNNIIKDTLTLSPDPLLGNDDDTLAYRARSKGKPSAVVIEATAPDGYSGKIYLIMSITPNAEIIGVRVVSHHETPGLGDYIELPKSPWIKNFDGKSHAMFKPADWKVKKDGGKFDYMAGATITPRAVIKAVHKALLYFEANSDTLLAPPPPKPAKQQETQK